MSQVYAQISSGSSVALENNLNILLTRRTKLQQSILKSINTKQKQQMVRKNQKHAPNNKAHDSEQSLSDGRDNSSGTDSGGLATRKPSAMMEAKFNQLVKQSISSLNDQVQLTPQDRALGGPIIGHWPKENNSTLTPTSSKHTLPPSLQIKKAYLPARPKKEAARVQNAKHNLIQNVQAYGTPEQKNQVKVLLK